MNFSKATLATQTLAGHQLRLDRGFQLLNYDLDSIIRYYLFYELISAISGCKIYLTGPVAQYNTFTGPKDELDIYCWPKSQKKFY